MILAQKMQVMLYLLSGHIKWRFTNINSKIMNMMNNSLIYLYETFDSDFKNIFVFTIRPFVQMTHPCYHFRWAMFELAYLCKCLVNSGFKNTFGKRMTSCIGCL